jgi:3-polyprenyl-4-hydroxybenzoate decarboxylase
VLSVEYYLKLIVVVDEDIDVFNEREVAWAVLTRSRAEKMTFLPGAMGAVLDPMSDPVTNTITKVGIDATLPLTGTQAERLRLPDDVMRWAGEVLARHPHGTNPSVR